MGILDLIRKQSLLEDINDAALGRIGYMKAIDAWVAEIELDIDLVPTGA